MEDDDDTGLFAISLSPPPSPPASEKVPRDFQSEADFQSILSSWRPRVQNGDIYKSLKFPVKNPSKPEAEEIQHAIEELYFLRRYGEARDLAEKVLEGVMGEALRRVVEGYKGRCEVKMEVGREREGVKCKG